MGLVAIAVGMGSGVVALVTRRRRDRISATYASSGGIVYSVIQFGCGGLLIAAGGVMIAIVLIGGR